MMSGRWNSGLRKEKIDMVHFADPPVLMQDVFPDLDAVLRLLEGGAPYTPLGGWMRPGLDPDAETTAMWFQEDWVHADYALEGSDLVLQNDKYIETAREFWGAKEIVPHSVYANLMIGLNECGPAHTDNPKFRGRERKNTPMWLLRLMLWSGLFRRWEITQATAIWWMNDIDEGGGIGDVRPGAPAHAARLRSSAPRLSTRPSGGAALPASPPARRRSADDPLTDGFYQPQLALKDYVAGCAARSSIVQTCAFDAQRNNFTDFYTCP